MVCSCFAVVFQLSLLDALCLFIVNKYTVRGLMRAKVLNGNSSLISSLQGEWDNFQGRQLYHFHFCLPSC